MMMLLHSAVMHKEDTPVRKPKTAPALVSHSKTLFKLSTEMSYHGKNKSR